MYFFVFIFIRLFAFNKQLVVGLHRHDYNLPSHFSPYQSNKKAFNFFYEHTIYDCPIS